MNIFVYSRVLGLGGNYPPPPIPSTISQPLITGFIVQSRSLKTSGLKHFVLWCSLSFVSEQIKTKMFFFYSAFVINFKGITTTSPFSLQPHHRHHCHNQDRSPPLFLQKRRQTFHVVKLRWPAAAAAETELSRCRAEVIVEENWVSERASKWPAGGQAAGL